MENMKRKKIHSDIWKGVGGSVKKKEEQGIDRKSGNVNEERPGLLTYAKPIITIELCLQKEKTPKTCLKEKVKKMRREETSRSPGEKKITRDGEEVIQHLPASGVAHRINKGAGSEVNT